jgi:hypothetical protein
MTPAWKYWKSKRFLLKLKIADCETHWLRSSAISSAKFELLSSQPDCSYRFDYDSSFFPPPRVYTRIGQKGMLFMMVFCTYNPQRST